MVDPLIERGQRRGAFTPRQIALALVSLAVAAALYILAASLIGSADLMQALAKVEWWVIALGLLLTTLSFLVRFLRWASYLRLFGQHVPHARNLLIYIAGLALTTTPGKAGETVRSIFLRQLGVPFPTSLAAFVCDRLADLIAILSISIILGSFLYARSLHWALVLVGVVLAAAGGVLIVRLLNGGTAERIRSILLRRIWIFMQPFASEVGKCLSSPQFIAGTIAGGLAYGMQAVAFGVTVKAVGAEIAWPALLFTFFFATLTGAASMIPGGIGSMELAMTGLLVHFGLSASDALAATLLTRVVTLWFAVALGGGCALFLNSRLRTT